MLLWRVAVAALLTGKRAGSATPTSQQPDQLDARSVERPARWSGLRTSMLHGSSNPILALEPRRNPLPFCKRNARSYESPEWRRAVLQMIARQQLAASRATPELVCSVRVGPGLGNLLHGVLSCLLLAMLTERALYLEWPSWSNVTFAANDPEGKLSMPSWHELIQLPGSWQLWDASTFRPRACAKQETLVWNATNGVGGGLPEAAHRNLREAWRRYPCVRVQGVYQSFLPLLSIFNPAFRQLLASESRGWLRPGDTFRQLFCTFVVPHPSILEAFESAHHRLRASAERTVVGVHLRTVALNAAHAHSGRSQSHLLKCAVQMARKLGHTAIFVAADTQQARAYAARYLQPFHGLEVTMGVDASRRAVGAGQSFGTRASALVELLMLASCDALVVHERSTFSSTAYSLAGVRPHMLAPDHRGNGLHGRRMCSQQHSTEPCAHACRGICRRRADHHNLSADVQREIDFQIQCNANGVTRASRQRPN